MDELQVYRYQLSELEESLRVDPDNEDLVQLKADIQEAITLHESLLEEPIAKKPKQDAANALLTDSSATSSSFTSSLKTNKAELFDKAGVKEDGWSIGHSCFLENGDEATVIGISANRLLVTIRLLSNSSVKVLHRDKLFNKKQPVSKARTSEDINTAHLGKQPASSAPEKRQSLQQQVKSKASKPKSTYKEYIQKKSAEQATKAHQWKSFTSSLQKKGPKNI